MSLGKPEKDCFLNLIEDANLRANTAENALFLGVIFTFISIPLAFPLCFGYVKHVDETDEQKLTRIEAMEQRANVTELELGGDPELEDISDSDEGKVPRAH